MPSLDALGPWNNVTPEFFQGAAARGAQLGLSQRQQEREEASAADRLRLAYDQLHSQEKRASEAAQVRLRVGLAAQQLRADSLNNLMQYRQKEQENQTAGLALRARHQKFLEDQASGKPTELEKFDTTETKSLLKKRSEELINDPAWTSLGKMNPNSTLYRDTLKGFQNKIDLVQMLRDKLGKNKRMKFNPDTQDVESVEQPTVEE